MLVEIVDGLFVDSGSVSAVLAKPSGLREDVPNPSRVEVHWGRHDQSIVLFSTSIEEARSEAGRIARMIREAT